MTWQSAICCVRFALVATMWLGAVQERCVGQGTEDPALVAVRVEGPNPATVPLGSAATLRVIWPGPLDAVVEPTPLLRLDGVRITSRRLRLQQPTFEWTLTPERPGQFQLPPPAVLVDGRRIAAEQPVQFSCRLAPAADEFAFLDVTPQPKREQYFVGESLMLRIRVGIDRAFAAENLQNTMGRSLGLPVRIAGDWLDQTEPATPTDPVGRPVSLVLGRREVTAFEQQAVDRAPAPRRIFEIHRKLPLRRSGPLTVPRSTLVFDYATEFGTDLFGDPQPTNRKNGRVYSQPLELSVTAPPLEGRPPEFTGALGRFRFDAELRPLQAQSTELQTAAPTGTLWRLDVRLRAATPPTFAATPWRDVRLPRLDNVDGIHVRGMTQTAGQDELIGSYELLITDPALRFIPPLRFASFDPTPPAGYRIARTTRLPIPGRAAPTEPTTGRAAPSGRSRTDGSGAAREPDGPSARTAPPALEWATRSIADTEEDAADRWPQYAALAGLFAPWIVALCAWAWLRQRRLERECPGRRRAMRAARSFRRSARTAKRRSSDVGQANLDRAERRRALTRYFAERLREPPAKTIAPEFERVLRRHGVSEAAALAATHGVRRIVDADYGSSRDCPGWGELLGLIASIEQDLPRDPRHTGDGSAKRSALRRGNDGANPGSWSALAGAAALATCIGWVAADPGTQDSAWPATDPFVAAEDAFADRRYEDAQRLYLDALPNAGNHRAAALENAAICAHLSGQDAEALWLIERALRNRPGAPELRQRQTWLRDALGRRAQHAPGNATTAPRNSSAEADAGGSLSQTLAAAGHQALRRSIAWFRTRTTQDCAWIGALLQAIGLIALILWLERASRNPRWRTLAGAGLAVGCGAIVAGLGVKQAFDLHPAAIVVVDRAHAYSDAHLRAPRAFSVVAGDRLTVRANTDRWLAVSSTDPDTGARRNGYLRAETARIVTR